MKRTLFLLCVVMLCAMVAMAQYGSSSTPSSTPSSAPSSSSSSSQTSPSSDAKSSSSSGQSATSADTQSSGSSGSMSQSSAASTGSGMVEGCIEKSGSDFYLQPTSGGQRVKLKSTEDLSAHVGHHVKLEGAPASGANASPNDMSAGKTASSDTTKSTDTSSSGASSSSDISKSSAFNVTKVDMVSASCPK